MFLLDLEQTNDNWMSNRVVDVRSWRHPNQETRYYQIRNSLNQEELPLQHVRNGPLAILQRQREGRAVEDPEDLRLGPVKLAGLEEIPVDVGHVRVVKYFLSKMQSFFWHQTNEWRASIWLLALDQPVLLRSSSKSKWITCGKNNNWCIGHYTYICSWTVALKYLQIVGILSIFHLNVIDCIVTDVEYHLISTKPIQNDPFLHKLHNDCYFVIKKKVLKSF